MDLGSARESEERFKGYIDSLASVIGHEGRHKTRKEQLDDYSRGLLTANGRKSVEPLAAVTAPLRVAAKHQSLLHFVGQAAWSDADVLTRVRELVQPVMERHGPIEAWIIDDTGFPKKGKHSVGVTRQYCGQLGKQDNCQVAVSLSISNHDASLPIGYRLYLPKEWATDKKRKKKTGVPKEIRFKTKPDIAIDLIRQAVTQGVSMGTVLGDAAYGSNTALRDSLTSLGLVYALGIVPNTGVWLPGTAPLPPKKWQGNGRKPTCLRRDGKTKPCSVRALALKLPESAWKTITWREGVDKKLTSRFARARVRPSHGDNTRTEPRAEEWLLIEWPEGDAEPIKYWFSTLPENITFDKLVDMVKLRWRIERDYQDLKQEVGLGHYEGRSWRGFHHHATLCIAAYGFLISERETIPPSGSVFAERFKKLTVPKDYQPRGTPHPDRTPCPQLDLKRA